MRKVRNISGNTPWSLKIAHFMTGVVTLLICIQEAYVISQYLFNDADVFQTIYKVLALIGLWFILLIPLAICAKR